MTSPMIITPALDTCSNPALNPMRLLCTLCNVHLTTSLNLIEPRVLLTAFRFIWAPSLTWGSSAAHPNFQRKKMPHATRSSDTHLANTHIPAYSLSCTVRAVGRLRNTPSSRSDCTLVVLEVVELSSNPQL